MLPMVVEGAVVCLCIAMFRAEDVLAPADEGQEAYLPRAFHALKRNGLRLRLCVFPTEVGITLSELLIFLLIS